MKHFLTALCGIILSASFYPLHADDVAPAEGKKIKIILVGDSTVSSSFSTPTRLNSSTLRAAGGVP
jgi:hypothetical protein